MTTEMIPKHEMNLALALPPEQAIAILREDGSDAAKAILHRIALQSLRMAEAKMYSDSGFVPVHLRGKLAAISVVLEIADNNGVDRFFALNECYVVHDKVSFTAKFYIGLFVKSGRIRGPISYTFIEDKDPEKMGVTASVVDAQTGETVSHTLLWKTIVKSGWSGKNTWGSDPRLMMKYRAAIQLIRTQYPDVMAGGYTREEMQEMNEDGVFERTPSTPQLTDFPTGGTITDRTETKKKRRKTDAKPEPEEPAPPLQEVAEELFEAVPEAPPFAETLKKAKAELRNCINPQQVQSVYDRYEPFCASDDDEAALAEACNHEAERING